jgi:hypothetical protein
LKLDWKIGFKIILEIGWNIGFWRVDIALDSKIVVDYFNKGGNDRENLEMC